MNQRCRNLQLKDVIRSLFGLTCLQVHFLSASHVRIHQRLHFDDDLTLLCDLQFLAMRSFIRCTARLAVKSSLCFIWTLPGLFLELAQYLVCNH